MNKNTYTVYCHTNKINGKKYIGITSQKPEKRWGTNGRNYKGQKFHNAIEKYGWDNFEHELLFNNLTEQSAKDKEIELIRTYNTQRNGYNISSGGDDIYDNSIPLSQYDLDGNFIKEWESASQIERELGYSKSSILRCVNGESKQSYGHIWIKKGDDLIIGNHLYKEYMNEIDMYEKEGTFIKTFISPPIASQETGISLSHIRECYNGNLLSAGGYVWRLHGDSFDKYRTNRTTNTFLDKSVYIYDLSGNLLYKFLSEKEASVFLECDASAVGRACRGGNISCKGYILRFDGDPFDKYSTNISKKVTKNSYNPKINIAVDQYTFDGEFVSTYPSISNASKTLGGVYHILDVINKKRKYAGGYYWTRHGEPLVIEDKKISVKSYYKDGNIAKKYDDICEAALEMNTTVSRMKEACVGKRITVGGFVWRYEEDDFDSYKTSRKVDAKVSNFCESRCING